MNRPQPPTSKFLGPILWRGTVPSDLHIPSRTGTRPISCFNETGFTIVLRRRPGLSSPHTDTVELTLLIHRSNASTCSDALRRPNYRKRHRDAIDDTLVRRHVERFNRLRSRPADPECRIPTSGTRGQGDVFNHRLGVRNHSIWIPGGGIQEIVSQIWGGQCDLVDKPDVSFSYSMPRLTPEIIAGVARQTQAPFRCLWCRSTRHADVDAARNPLPRRPLPPDGHKRHCDDILGAPVRRHVKRTTRPRGRSADHGLSNSYFRRGRASRVKFQLLTS